MVGLEQHIEWLLQDNDCVIVPGLGGFITHYTPAKRVPQENCFLPPTRIIGFNPQLKLNDGLLVQSYMAVHHINFSEACQKITIAVNKLLIQLHENGKISIGNIGELRLSVHGTYSFIPFDRQLSAPGLYGLAKFEMCELKDLKQTTVPDLRTFNPVSPQRRRYGFKFKTSYLSNAVAMIAIIALFFFLPTPIENTEIASENYAQLLPNDILAKLEKQSLAITPIIIKNNQAEQNYRTPVTQNSRQANSSQKKKVMPVAVKEVKVTKAKPETTPKESPKEVVHSAPVSVEQPSKAITTPSKKYHIIVASVGTKQDAEAMAEQLIKQGYTKAKAIIGNGKMRVSIDSYATESEAYRYVNELRKNVDYQQAWVLKQ